MNTIARTLTAIAFTWIGGCADYSVGELRDTSIQPLGSKALNLCTQDSLVWSELISSNEQVCAGAWSYQQEEQCWGQFASCGKVPCTEWKQCGVPYSQGGQRVTKTLNSNFGAYVGVRYEYVLGKPRPFPRVEDAIPYCEAQLDSRIEFVEGWEPKWPPGYQTSNLFWQVDTHPDLTKWWLGKVEAVPSVPNLYYVPCYTRVTYHHPEVKAQSACGCAEEQPYRHCWDYDWSCGSTQEYSAPGLARTDIPAPERGDARTPPQRRNFSCTSCEDLPLENDGDARAKFSCLRRSFDQARKANLEREYIVPLVVHMKLLFELWGDTLEEDQQRVARTLYEDYLDTNPRCGPMQGPSIGAACMETASSHTLAGPLALCHRLQDYVVSGARVSHVSADLLAQELTQCLHVLDRVDSLSDEACHDQYMTNMTRILEALITRDFQQIVTDDTGQLVHLREALARIQEWYEHASPVQNREALLSQQSSLLGAFWRRVHEQASPAPQTIPVEDSAVESLLAEVFETGLSTDRAVLHAAFRDPAPLTSAPLLDIVADALELLAERIDDVSPLQDVACQYVGCQGVTTELSALWEFIATLHNPAIFARVAGAEQVRPEYRSVFAAIADEYHALEAAYTSAEGNEAGAFRDFLARETGPQSEALRALIERAVQRNRLFARHQNFHGSPSNTLHGGMQEDYRNNLIEDLRDAALRLDGSIEQYRSNVVHYIGDVLSLMQNGAQELDIMHKVEADLRRAWFAGIDRELLRLRDDAAEHAMGTFVDAFRVLIESDAVDSDRYVQTDTLPILNLDAAKDTHYDPSTAHAVFVHEIGVRDANGAPHHVAMNRGQVLRVSVGGAWAPTCAIRKAYPDIPILDAQTGSEGYRIQHSETESSIRSYYSSEEHFVQQTHSSQSCWGLSASLDPLTVVNQGLPVGKISVSGSFQQCRSESEGERETHGVSNSQTSQSGSAVQFSAGLRASGTPLDAPAGALLLVATNPPDHPTDADALRDVVVVRPGTTYVAEDDLRVYLVVNDRADCRELSHVGPLSVTMSLFTPMGQLAVALGEAMAETLARFRTQRVASFANATSVLSTELAALRSFAHQQLTLACQCDLSNVPSLLSSFFDNWVNHELARLERHTMSHALTRELDGIGHRLQALDEDLRAAQSQSRLLALLPQRRLQNLAGDRLRSVIRHATKTLNHSLYPVMFLRFPTALQAFREVAQADLSGLLEIDFAAPIDQQAETLAHLVWAVKDNLALADTDVNNQLVKFAMTFLKPQEDCVPNPLFGIECPEEIAAVFPRGEDRPTFSRANPIATKLVWDGVRSLSEAPFRVSLQDAYDTSVFAPILCGDAVPVIQSMSVYAVYSGNGAVLNALNMRLVGEIDPNLLFPDERDANAYYMENIDWVKQLGFPIRFGAREEQAISTHENTAADIRFADGLSPFTTFTVDFSKFQEQDPTFWDKAEAFVLVFHLDVRHAGAGMPWLPNCN